MGKIAILPDILCNQIAAGEVVERPAAVVKELVENSIDAGADRISVSLIDGGRREIRVVDNGCGMSSEDALLSLERHATSKISTASDLGAISSLGFRGEAIPSIAAVSRFELSTREHDALSGTSIKVEGGVIKDVRETGCPAGTQVLVRDIFYCVPARRKFLRTPETELAYITDQFLRISMANHRIHMQLISRDRVLCDYPKCDEPRERASQVLGPDIGGSLSLMDFEQDGVTVSGFLAPPDVQRSNAQSLFLFVNGRPVWDRLVQRTVLTAYEALIPRGKFPVAVIFIEISPALVDVNVHPAKREIRFRNPGEVISVLREAVFRFLASIRPGPGRPALSEGPVFGVRDMAPAAPVSFEHQMRFSPGRSFGSMRPAAERNYPPFPPEDFLTPPAAAPAESPPEAIPMEPPPIEPDTAPEENSYSALGLIGQLGNSFILLEAPDGLILIDQHAAHERIVFNGLAKKTPGASQLLTRPVVVDLLPKEAVLLQGLLPSLRSIGFDIESFGGSSFAVHGVPAVLSGFKPEEVLRDYLRYAEEECPANDGEIMLGVARIAACHSSVRAGQRLKPEEMRRLLELLDSAETPFTCPHGRPLSHKLTYDQIFRFFKRT